MKYRSNMLYGVIAGTLFLTGCAGTNYKSGTATGASEAEMQLKKELAQTSEQLKSQEAIIAQLKTENQKAKSEVQLAMASSAESSVVSDLFPPKAEPGHCYARVLTPAEYKEETESVLIREKDYKLQVVPAVYENYTETVLDQEASNRLEVVPATYETVTERVMIKPESTRLIKIPAEFKTVEEKVLDQEASTRIEVVPATYESVTERVMVKPESTRLVKVPAEYKTVTEKVLDKPAHTVWKRGQGFASGAIETALDQSTGEIMCLVEVPAIYKTITKTVLVSAETTREEVIPAVYKDITKSVVKTPAQTKEIEIPATYKKITKTVLVKPETTREEVIPAVYKDVTKTVVKTPATTRSVAIPASYKEVTKTKVVSPAQENKIEIPAEYTTVSKRVKVSEEQLKWEEVLCEVNMTQSVIASLQTKLQGMGFYNGPVDSIFGSQTMKAANQYASAKGLATGDGYITIDTMKSLGL
ncbi:MAG: peptidoglycan-binding protein [Acidiferrobacterales bacterium]|nr:peptidoglycan-binding protein [Acidiferrobacterales bacterium]